MGIRKKTANRNVKNVTVLNVVLEAKLHV